MCVCDSSAYPIRLSMAPMCMSPLPVSPRGVIRTSGAFKAKFQASQPETGDLPKSPGRGSQTPQKVPTARARRHPKPPQPEFTDLPKSPKLEFSELSKKGPAAREATPLPRKPEVPEAPSQKTPQQPELSNTPRSPVEPKVQYSSQEAPAA